MMHREQACELFESLVAKESHYLYNDDMTIVTQSESYLLRGISKYSSFSLQGKAWSSNIHLQIHRPIPVSCL